MDMKIMICDQCSHPILEPGPHARARPDDPPLVTTCRHVYHYMCMHNIYQHATETNSQNTKIATCVHPGCSKKLTRCEFFCLDVSTVVRKIIPPPDNRITELVQQVQLQKDLNQTLQKRAATLVEQMRTMEARNSESLKKLEDVEIRYNMLMNQYVDQYYLTPIQQPISTSSTSATFSAEQTYNNLQLSYSNTTPAQIQPPLPNQIPFLPQVGNLQFGSIPFTKPTQIPPPVPNQIPSLLELQFGSPPFELQPNTTSTMTFNPPIIRNLEPSTNANTLLFQNTQILLQNPANASAEPFWNQPVLNNLYPQYPGPGYQLYSPYYETRSGVGEPHMQPSQHRSNKGAHVALKPNKPKIEPPKQKRGTSAERARYHRRYRRRFGTESTELAPFYPLNSYPLCFTVAAREEREEEYLVVLFAYQIFIIGDGHAVGMAKYLIKNKPYRNSLDTGLYRRDLLASDLVRRLKNLPSLPKKIMLSIGNFDVTCKTSHADFWDEMMKLSLLLKDNKLEELYLIPLIRRPDQDQVAFDQINLALQYDWGSVAGGKTIRLESMFEGLTSTPPSMDEFGPFYDIALYVPITKKIHEKYIPKILGTRAKMDESIPSAPAAEDPQQIYAQDVQNALGNIEKTPSVAEVKLQFKEEKIKVDEFKEEEMDLDEPVNHPSTSSSLETAEPSTKQTIGGVTITDWPRVCIPRISSNVFNKSQQNWSDEVKQEFPQQQPAEVDEAPFRPNTPGVIPGDT